MESISKFARICRGIRDALGNLINPDNRREIVRILSEEYVEKSENVVKFTNYAARMVYPQFRDKLLRIADEERRSIHWLAEEITGLGGELPQWRFSPAPARNAWERLLTVLEKKKRHGSDRMQRLLELERIDPRIAQEVRRMHEEEDLHRREIQAMMMRSDPQAGWASNSAAP